MAYAKIEVLKKGNAYLLTRMIQEFKGAWTAENIFYALDNIEFDATGISLIRDLAVKPAGTDTIVKMAMKERKAKTKGYRHVSIHFENAVTRVVPVVTMSSGRGWADKTNVIEISVNATDADFRATIDKAFLFFEANATGSGKK